MHGEHIGELKKWAAEIAKSGTAGDDVSWRHAAELIGKHFSVHTHEVAILGLTPDERFLRFLTPDNLRPVGKIPLSSTNSLAVRTVRDQRPEIVNHFSVVPHASVFEGVPINDSQRSEAIQKIMSAPVMVGKKALGVAQVSRKGASSAEAGPDFTSAQLRDLKAIADVLAPCIILSSTPTPA
ncbi:MAG: GAF domain-containing protein [Candidatus Acidiferrales bacterium]